MNVKDSMRGWILEIRERFVAHLEGDRESPAAPHFRGHVSECSVLFEDTVYRVHQ